MNIKQKSYIVAKTVIVLIISEDTLDIEFYRYTDSPLDSSFLHTICRVFQRRHEALSREVLSNRGTGIGINAFVKVVIFICNVLPDKVTKISGIIVNFIIRLSRCRLGPAYHISIQLAAALSLPKSAPSFPRSRQGRDLS